MTEPKFVLGDEMIDRAARALEAGAGDGSSWEDLARRALEAAFDVVPIVNYGVGLCLQFFDLVICVKEDGVRSAAGVYMAPGDPTEGFDALDHHLDLRWSEKPTRRLTSVAISRIGTAAS